jgi:hypothetical protein
MDGFQEGISKEKLEERISEEVKRYLHGVRVVNLYKHSEDELKEALMSANPNSNIAGNLENAIENVLTLYEKVLEFGAYQERLNLLVELYKEHFPGEEMELLDSSSLEEMVAKNLELRASQYGLLLRRFEGMINQSIAEILKNYKDKSE